jgi:hypothetical protein
LRKRRLEIAPALRGALGIAAPDANLLEIEDLGVHLGLQARLYAGAEDAQHAIAAAELARHQRGNGGGTHVGEMPGVGQEGHGFAGFRRRQHHHPVTYRHAARQVAGKRRGDLEREIFSAAAIAGFHVDLGVNGCDPQVHRHRHVALAAGIGDDRLAHAGDDLSVREDAPDLRQFENAH